MIGKWKAVRVGGYDPKNPRKKKPVKPGKSERVSEKGLMKSLVEAKECVQCGNLVNYGEHVTYKHHRKSWFCRRCFESLIAQICPKKQ